MSYQYPMNQTFKQLTERAYSLGKSLPKVASTVMKSGKFQKLADTVGSATGKAKELFNKLGSETTNYGGNTNYESYHPGVDIAAASGTPIKAFTGGTVVEARTGQTHNPNVPSFGNYLVIQDKNGNYQRYSHLKDEFVKVGSQISSGQDIGTVGSTGSTYSPSGNGEGAHLDYRIYSAAKKYFNPSFYLNTYLNSNA